MPVLRKALNVITEKIEDIDDIDDASLYDINKVRQPPYQAPHFKQRILWIHKTNGYVCWLASAKTCLVYASDVLIGEYDTHELAIGEFINEYRFDKTVYAAALSGGSVSMQPPAKKKKTASTAEASAPAPVPAATAPASAPVAAAPASAPVAAAPASAPVAAAPASAPVAAAPALPTAPASAPVAAAPAAPLAAAVPPAASGAAQSPAAATSTETDNQSEINRLKQELEAERARADAAQEAEEKMKKTHESYKKTKQREVTNLKGEIKDKEKELADAPSRQDIDRLKADASMNKIAMSDEERQAALGSKANPRTAFLQMIEICTKALDDAVKDWTAAGSTATRAPFEFMDNSGTWVEITDTTIIAALQSLMTGKSKKVSYSHGGHNYEATLARQQSKKPSSKSKMNLYEIDQVNTDPQYKTVRQIRDTSLHQETSAAVAKKQMAEILFGSKSFIELDNATVSSMLSGFRFDVDQTDEPCLPLARLAEKFSAVGSGFKYTVPAGTKGTNCAVKCDGWQSEGLEHRSELLIKPIALFNWLTIAQARGYTAARIVMHGGTKEAYEGVKADPIGFKMELAGRHGQAFGNGLYFGLSDHATVGYNASSGLPPGSAILTLLLTHERVGWQHHHHGGYTSGFDETQAKEYKTITFSTPIEGIDNAIVVHEPPLTLPLGIVRAFDPKQGWAMHANAYGQ